MSVLWESQIGGAVEFAGGGSEPQAGAAIDARYGPGMPILLAENISDIAVSQEIPLSAQGVKIDRPVQVWSADIPYVPMPSGFMYLTATIDWYGRLVVSWRLSNTLDGSFCQAMLEESLTRGSPAIFNTDQGVQFTSEAWTNRLESAGVKVSRDGVGRCHDNIFVERLWRAACSTKICIHALCERARVGGRVASVLWVLQ